MRIKNLLLLFTICMAVVMSIISFKKTDNLPIVAIANYGPHVSLEASIAGIKEELTRVGFIEGENIQYEISDVGFDAALIPQMITKLKNQSPKVMVVMTTPVAQFAKGTIKEIPLVYSVITDPVAAGLLENEDIPKDNVTGSSDKQDLVMLLKFSKKFLPQAYRVGLLYASSEINDIALVTMMQQAAQQLHMEVVAIPVDQARDVPLRMQSFKDKVDFIYVGTSGPIQPTLPIIASEASKMGIPVLNVDAGAVKEHMVLASFGVDYKKVGVNTGKLVAQILNGSDPVKLQPVYPTTQDHHGFISKQQANVLGLVIPGFLDNVDIVE
jgi:putative ABC transport system substrate-binding protein